MATNSISSQKTIQQIIDASSKSTSDRKTGELGKDDFLNLLVTQLRYQDPLNPVDDKEFIGQMAQFSSLEQMQNMNTSLSQSRAFSLIGKRITANVADEKTGEINIIEGDVTNVRMDSGKTYVVVRGQDIPVDSITDISDGLMSSQSNLSAFTNLIGSKVSGYVYDPDTGEVVPVDGTVKSIRKGVYEDYAVMDGVEMQVSKIITESPSTDPNFTRNYLESNKGKEVEIETIDRSTGYKVQVNAILRDYTISDDGKVTAILDQLYVPVESVTQISKSGSNISSYTNLIGFSAKGSVHDSRYANFVGVRGVVKSIQSGVYEDYAVMDDVDVEIAEINSDTPLTDQEAKEKYLDDHILKDISVVINDPVSRQKVSVNAVLESYSIDETTGKITAKLNKLNVPVESIEDIAPVPSEN